MHPGTVAELQEGLAAGNLLSGLSATRWLQAQRLSLRAPCWASVLKVVLGQIVFPVEKALGQVYKEKVSLSVASLQLMKVCFLPHPYKGHFTAWWKQEGACEVVTGSLIFSRVSMCLLQAVWSEGPTSSLLNMLPSPNSYKDLIPSLRSSWWAHRCGEPAVPSFWLPENVLSVPPLGSLGFLKVSDELWNHKHCNISHCPMFLHPRESGSVSTVGQDLTALSGGLGCSSTSTWCFWVILFILPHFVPLYCQLGCSPSTF